MTEIEVFADACCPFTHVGLCRLVDERAARGRDDIVLVVRSWPLELVNGKPLDPEFIAHEVDEIRAQVAPGLFANYDPAAFPATSLPAMALAAAAYESAPETGEEVSLELRRLLFEEGRDISDEALLAEVAARHGLTLPDDDAAVRADLEEGRARGVIGSPHFFVGKESFFCPALDIKKVDGKFHIEMDADSFARFLDACLG